MRLQGRVLERFQIYDRLCGPCTGPAYPSRDL